MIPLKSLPQKTKFCPKIRPVFVGALAFAAGIANGFLGTGGGILLMAALSLLPEEDENAARDRFAWVIAAILPLSLISAFVYGNALDFEAALPYLFPGVLGGITGALLLDRLNPRLVKKLFALMTIWAGVNFLR